jgi:hypothetical protein
MSDLKELRATVQHAKTPDIMQDTAHHRIEGDTQHVEHPHWPSPPEGEGWNVAWRLDNDGYGPCTIWYRLIEGGESCS